MAGEITVALGSILPDIAGVHVDATTIVIGCSVALVLLIGLDLLKDGFESMSSEKREQASAQKAYLKKYRNYQRNEDFKSDMKKNNARW